MKLRNATNSKLTYKHIQALLTLIVTPAVNDILAAEVAASWCAYGMPRLSLVWISLETNLCNADKDLLSIY